MRLRDDRSKDTKEEAENTIVGARRQWEEQKKLEAGIA